MNNSRVLQLIAQIGKIFSKVAFVFSIIGICGCFVGLLSNVFGSGKVFKIGGVTIYGLLADFDAYNVKSQCNAGGMADCMYWAGCTCKICGTLFS